MKNKQLIRILVLALCAQGAGDAYGMERKQVSERATLGALVAQHSGKAAALGLLAGAGLVGAAVYTDAGDQSALNSAGSALILGSLGFGLVRAGWLLGAAPKPVAAERRVLDSGTPKSIVIPIDEYNSLPEHLRPEDSRVFIAGLKAFNQAIESGVLLMALQAQVTEEALRQAERSGVKRPIIISAEEYDSLPQDLRTENPRDFIQRLIAHHRLVNSRVWINAQIAQMGEGAAVGGAGDMDVLRTENVALKEQLERLQAAVDAAEKLATQVGVEVEEFESTAQEIATLRAQLEEKDRRLQAMTVWCEQLEESLSVKSAEAQEYVRGLIERDPSVVIHELVEWYQRVHEKEVTRDEAGNIVFPAPGTVV